MKNRKIKFRVWDKLEKRFDKNYHIFMSMNGNVENLQSGAGEDDYELSQFTGLVDKNGQEIYEGDLVKFSFFNPAEERENTVGEVYWDNEMAMFCFDRLFGYAMNDSSFIEESLEVIGNIFENKK